jgi:hypothetical protein
VTGPHRKAATNVVERSNMLLAGVAPRPGGIKTVVCSQSGKTGQQKSASHFSYVACR